MERDNSLLVRGTPEGMEELRGLIRLLDVRLDPVVLRAEIAGPGANGKPLALASLIHTLAGKEAVVEEKTVGGAAAQASRLQIRVQPLPQGDGSFLVENSWDLSLPLTGGPKGATTVRLEKRLSTTTRIRPGETVVVGEVNADQWGGKGKLVLRLTAIRPSAD